MTNYSREADELINLVYEGSPMRSSATRQKIVANWLREFVAALSFGCTGLTADPDGPQLEDFLASHPLPGPSKAYRDSHPLERPESEPPDRELGGEG